MHLLQRYIYPPSHHLLHSRYLPQHPRHPVADHKHNRTEKQGRQHLIHLPVMAEYSPQAGKIFGKFRLFSFIMLKCISHFTFTASSLFVSEIIKCGRCFVSIYVFAIYCPMIPRQNSWIPPIKMITQIVDAHPATGFPNNNLQFTKIIGSLYYVFIHYIYVISQCIAKILFPYKALKQ